MTPVRRLRRMRAVVLLWCAALLAVACQPAGGPGASPTPTSGAATGSAIGAPPSGLPRTLEQLTQRGLLVAEEWQDEPVLVEIEVDLDDEGRWHGARLVYLAADADRFLALTTAGSGFSQQQPTLSTLEVPPIPAAAVAEIPEFPEGAAAPADLVAVPDVAECGVHMQPTVLYTTGAPVAWDGVTWTSPPAWRATVTAHEGDAAAVFADVTGGDVRCLTE